LKLERLTIQNLPGIEPGFELTDIDPAVNLVTGPNGIGKSSLIRALRYLIGGADRDDPGALSLAAEFGNGGQWRVERAGSQIVWRFEGREAEAPALPGRDQLHCYWLSMEDLLRADERDERLVRELRRALAGGYDLNALRSDGAFSVGSRIGQTEQKRLQDARRQLHHVENEYAALRREEREIPELETRIEAARRATTRADRLQRALGLLDVRRQRLEAEAALGTFPDEMDRLRGDELERLNALEERREARQREHDDASRQQRDAEAALRETGLAADRPAREALEAEKSRLEAVRRDRGLIAERRTQLETLRAEEEQARSQLGGLDASPELTPENVAEAESLARRLAAKAAEADDLSVRIREAPELASEPEIGRHARAIEGLRGWLATKDRGDGRIFRALAVTAAGAAIAAGAALWAAAWIAFAAAVVSLAGAGWAGWLSRGFGADEARRRFAETGLEAPAEWRPDAVRERLEAIDARHAELLRARALVQEAEGERRRLQRVQGELDKLEDEKRTMAGRLGFDPKLTALGLDHFVRQVSRYQQAAAQRTAQEAVIDDQVREADARLGQVGTFLEQWWVAADGTLEGLTAGLARLEERCRDAEASQRQSADAARDVKRLDEQLTALIDETATLYRDAGLEPGQRRDLEDRGERLAQWSEQRETVRDAQRREAEHRQALEGEPELLAEVEHDDRESLARELEQAQSEAENLEALQKRRTEIRTRLEYAGNDRKMEQAAADLDAARESLRERRGEALFADAGQFLLDAVEQEHHSEHEPEVLRDARERFRRFTHFEWDLVLDDERGFTARDERRGRRHPLEELSSGTRMQLLLAVRLAWTRRVEQGREPLPLFLDEALTTADETRFRSVAQSLERLAADEGRQVFYLSARRQEGALWEQLTGRRPHHVDLAAVRFGARAASAEALALPERAPLTAPDGRTPEQYAAALGVPAVDPRLPEADLHLFHLLRDALPLLHRLMEQWRIASLGQLEFLLESTAAQAAIPDTDSRDRLAGRCAAARAWVVAWRHGRGRPVDRVVLEQSGAVSSTFIDRVAEVAGERGGDGRAIIDALRDGEVARFRSSNTDELEQWLEREGYIDREEPLSAEDREQRTLMEASAVTEAEEARKVAWWLEGGMAGEHQLGNTSVFP